MQCPLSGLCHSHTEMVWSGPSSTQARRAPPSARENVRQATARSMCPAPITASVARDTEFQTRTCGWRSKLSINTDWEYDFNIRNNVLKSKEFVFFLSNTTNRWVYQSDCKNGINMIWLSHCATEDENVSFTEGISNIKYPGIKSVVSSTLSTCYNQLVWMYSYALDVVSVSSVVPLTLLFNVEQHNDGCHEVYYLARWQQVQVTATIFTPGININYWFKWGQYQLHFRLRLTELYSMINFINNSIS